LIYFVTCGSGSLLGEVLLLAESAAEVLPKQHFVWLVGGSWSPRLASALQSIPGATAEPWQPRFSVGAGTAVPPHEVEIPQALLEIASRPDCTWLLYCAPGILWMSPPTEVLAESSGGDVLLVPTLLQPQAVTSLPVCELEALRQGVFSHRFLAVRNSSKGCGFLRWWRKRLLEIPLQAQSPASWLHLAPPLFPCVRILRSPRLNVHRGSLHERHLDGSFPRVTADGKPAVFFDLGARGDLPVADHGIDLQTRRSFRSVLDWYEYRLGIVSRFSAEYGLSIHSEV
jgi:hypothetical protein